MPSLASLHGSNIIPYQTINKLLSTLICNRECYEPGLGVNTREIYVSTKERLVSVIWHAISMYIRANQPTCATTCVHCYHKFKVFFFYVSCQEGNAWILDARPLDSWRGLNLSRWFNYSSRIRKMKSENVLFDNLNLSYSIYRT